MHGASFLNCARCTVITDLHTSKRSTQKAFYCCGAILEIDPAATAGSACETWTVAAADGVGFARVRWEINFLLTFEIAPFISKHTVSTTYSECVCNFIYPACKMHVTYCHLWPVCFYWISQHYLINGMIFYWKKRLLNTKCVFWFSPHLCLKHFLFQEELRETF